jgi:hypothetical protein
MYFNQEAAMLKLRGSLQKQAGMRSWGLSRAELEAKILYY